MSNPFHVQSRPLPPPKFPSRTPPPQSNKLAMAGVVVVVLAAALFLIAKQPDWLPDPLKGLLPTPDGWDNRVFVAQADLNRDQARALYRDALSALQSNDYDTALSLFKRLEGVFPGLRDILWLHEAECYAGQGNEWAVQKKLNALIQQVPASPFKTIALYRIGQSQFRGSEWDKAKETFAKVREDAPISSYATGSLYYQGALLAKDDNTKAQAVAPLTEYLQQCHDCKFSGDAADLLERLLPLPSAEVHGLIGLADAAASRDLTKTLAHLEKGPLATTWLALGKSRIHAGKASLGVQTLITGLPFAKDTDQAKTAVDMLVSHTPEPAKRLTYLKALSAKHLAVGGDYVLWKLAELDAPQANGYYHALLQQFPKSDYAPESGWRLLWPTLLNGDVDAYVAQSQQYIDRYPYARSAPKALFWLAKVLEKSNPAESTRAYLRVQDQYPTNYYAFRAAGRLKVMSGGQRDPGWVTNPARTNYPPAFNLNTLDILPPSEQMGGTAIRQEAAELQAIGAAEDTKLLVAEASGSLPPAVESWAEETAGDRAKGIRVIRDALEAQAKAAILQDQSVKAVEAKDALKLLYPVYFSDTITQVARKNSIDPYLVQALMREESYFNEFAISGSNARGLMQLLPSTAGDVADWEGLASFKTADLFVPAINIQLGSRYLGHLHQLFGGNSMPSVGAYNGGPGAMKGWVKASPYFNNDPDMFVERIPYEQSRDYIKKVFTGYWNYCRIYGS